MQDEAAGDRETALDRRAAREQREGRAPADARDGAYAETEVHEGQQPLALLHGESRAPNGPDRASGGEKFEGQVEGP